MRLKILAVWIGIMSGSLGSELVADARYPAIYSMCSSGWENTNHGYPFAVFHIQNAWPYASTDLMTRFEDSCQMGKTGVLVKIIDPYRENGYGHPCGWEVTWGISVRVNGDEVFREEAPEVRECENEGFAPFEGYVYALKETIQICKIHHRNHVSKSNSFSAVNTICKTIDIAQQTR